MELREVVGTDGRTYSVDARGRVVATRRPTDDYDYGWVEGPTCSLCDALGHGYPGGGPCPLEERGANDFDDDRRYRW